MNYLLDTDSKVLLDEELAKKVKDSPNKIIYSYKETSIKEIIEEASYVSMFAEMKYLIVKYADFFGKTKISETDQNLLLNYLKNPNPYTTLIFVTYEEIDKRKNLVKFFINQNSYIHLETPKGYELINNTIKLAGEKGYLLDTECAKYICNACLNNWDLIWNEIQKFELLFPKNRQISLPTLKKIICYNASENQFKFIEAVVTKNMNLAINLLEDLKILKTEPLQLLNLLAREYRLMLMLSLLEDQNYFPKDIINELKIPDWQFQKLQKNKIKYHKDDLKDFLLSIAKKDFLIKSGKLDKWLAIDLFLLEAFEY